MQLPNFAVTRELIVRYAALIDRLSDELGERPLVLPTREFFPDHFTKDAASLERLAARMAVHAGMADIPVRTLAIGEEAEGCSSSGGCGTGACGTGKVAEAAEGGISDDGSSWTIHVPAIELQHPIVLTTRLARSLAEIFLHETSLDGAPIDEPAALTIDLAAIALGFGVLMLEGSYVYSKSCGGPSVAQYTALPCPELAVVFALFVSRAGQSRRSALKELGVTQRDLAGEALALLDSNPAIAKALRTGPAKLALGAFEITEPRPALVRLFSRKGDSEGDGDLAELAELERGLAKQAARRPETPRAADPKRDELRALVDEAFDGASVSD